MTWIRELRLFVRAAKRVGAFKRGLDAGMPAEQARAYSDETFPPSTADLEYETELRNRKPMLPWGSVLGLLVTAISLVSISQSALAETGSLPSAQMLIGFGVAQIGWVMLAFGLIVGRFLIFDLDGRLKTVGCAIAALITGTIIVNV